MVEMKPLTDDWQEKYLSQDPSVKKERDKIFNSLEEAKYEPFLKEMYDVAFFILLELEKVETPEEEEKLYEQIKKDFRIPFMQLLRETKNTLMESVRENITRIAKDVEKEENESGN